MLPAIARILLGFALLMLASPLSATVTGTKHDLSDASWGADNSQVCVWCHTPHSANPVGLLWNRAIDPTKTFVRYSSPTMDTVPGDPKSGSSAFCLGCHDGTLGSAVVAGYTVSDKHDLVNAPGPGGIPDTTSWPNCQRCHPEMYGLPAVKWFSLNLSNQHPIAMTYPTAAQDPAFKVPPDLAKGWSDIKLFTGKVECASCHEPHDNSISPFLRMSNAGSALCLRCHAK